MDFGLHYCVYHVIMLFSNENIYSDCNIIPLFPFILLIRLITKKYHCGSIRCRVTTFVGTQLISYGNYFLFNAQHLIPLQSEQ